MSSRDWYSDTYCYNGDGRWDTCYVKIKEHTNTHFSVRGRQNTFYNLITKKSVLQVHGPGREK
jgi:hypothetical protein